MKRIFLFTLAFITLSLHSQTNEDVVVKIYPDKSVPKYKQTVVFLSYLVNNSNKTLKIPNPIGYEPGWYLTKNDWILSDSTGKRINRLPFLDNATGKFKSSSVMNLHPGDSAEVQGFRMQFNEVGKYTLSFTYDLNPRYSTLYEKSEDARQLSVVYAKNEPYSFIIEKPKWDDFDDFEKGHPVPFDSIYSYRSKTKLEDVFLRPEETINVAVKVTNQKDFNDICRLKNLRTLVISASNIDSIPETLYDLSLFELQFSTNSDVVLDLNKFKDNMQEMRRLIFKGNYNLIFPNSIGHLKYLTNIRTQGNLYSTLPADIGALSKLRDFDISNNELIHKLPDSFTDIRGLWEIRIINCENIDQAPAIKKSAVKVYKINSCPKISTFPDLSGIAYKLTVLDFADCSIKVIPANINQFQKVYSLNLSNNQIEILPTQLLEMGALQTLDIRGNKIHPKDKTFKAFIKLDSQKKNKKFWLTYDRLK